MTDHGRHRGVLVLGALLVVAGCGGPEQEGAALVRKVGAERLVAAAALLRTEAAADSTVHLRPASWPAVIRELEPRAVVVTHDGVFVQRRHGYVEEEGVFVAFAGAVIDTHAGRDPSFTPIAAQVYWYKVKG